MITTGFIGEIRAAAGWRVFTAITGPSAGNDMTTMLTVHAVNALAGQLTLK